MPDDIVFVPEMPMTATGKIHTPTLREHVRDDRLPTAGRPPAGLEGRAGPGGYHDDDLD